MNTQVAHGVAVHQASPLVTYGITAVVVAIVIAIRSRQMMRSRTLKLERLWIVPAVYAAIVVWAFAQNPPHGSGWLIAAAALVLGAGVGWQRGRMMAIHVDPATHSLTQKGSPLAILFLVAIVVVRTLAQAEGRAMHLNVALLTGAALTFALGMFTTTRIEMYLRARRILGEAPPRVRVS